MTTIHQRIPFFHCYRIKPARLFSTNQVLRYNTLPIRPAIDFKHIANNVESLQTNADLRNVQVNIARVAILYKEWCQAKYECQAEQHKTNTIAQEMKILSNHSNPATTDNDLQALKSEQLKAQGIQAKTNLKRLIPQVNELENKLYAEAIHIPNRSDPDVPIGPEQNAKIIHLFGSPTSVISPESIKDHVELAHALKILDLAAGAKVTGTSFYYLKGIGALLELALVQLSMKLAQKHGFVPVSAPDIVKQSISAACGFHPRDPQHTQNYNVSCHHHPPPDMQEAWVLSATSEIPLAGMHANENIPKSKLPLKYVSMGRAYRAEAGGRGAESRGLYRVHQFTKVELFALAEPTVQASNIVWQSILNVQYDMINALELHARVLLMPTEELGAAATMKIDMEAWMPGRAKHGLQPWGEISSMSACSDYQSRRLSIRTEPPRTRLHGQSSHSHRPFVFTLNGTAAAIPRLIIALLEQHQQQDGSVYVPHALRPYLADMEEIRVS